MRSEALVSIDDAVLLAVPPEASYVSIAPTTSTLRVEMLGPTDELLDAHEVQFERGHRIPGGLGAPLRVPPRCEQMRVRHEAVQPVATEVWFIVGCNSGAGRDEA
jgi:hypothetical protein